MRLNETNTNIKDMGCNMDSVTRVADGLIWEFGKSDAHRSAVHMLGSATTEECKTFWYAVIQHIEGDTQVASAEV